MFQGPQARNNLLESITILLLIPVFPSFIGRCLLYQEKGQHTWITGSEYLHRILYVCVFAYDQKVQLAISFYFQQKHCGVWHMWSFQRERDQRTCGSLALMRQGWAREEREERRKGKRDLENWAFLNYGGEKDKVKLAKECSAWKEKQGAIEEGAEACWERVEIVKPEDDSNRQSHFPGLMSRKQDYQESPVGTKLCYWNELYPNCLIGGRKKFTLGSD